MIVLHAFSPSTSAVRQKATWSTLELVRRHARHVVIDWPCLADDDYGRGIAWCWNRGESLCVLEHDLVPTLEQLLELERCPQQICTQAYQLYEPNVGDAAPVFAFRVKDGDHGLRWGIEGEEWGDYSPLGCTRFRPPAMEQVIDWSPQAWSTVDHYIAARIAAAGLRIHVHWPAIPHWHR